jgi:hypothetical protein
LPELTIAGQFLGLPAILKALAALMTLLAADSSSAKSEDERPTAKS